jgi:hypothetical protein
MSPDTGREGLFGGAGITPLASAGLREDSGAVAERQGSFRADLPGPPRWRRAAASRTVLGIRLGGNSSLVLKGFIRPLV